MNKFAFGLVAATLWVSSVQAGTLYSIRDSDNSLVSIDTDTLAYTVIGETGVSGDFGGLAYDGASDTLYWIPGRGNDSLYSVNRSSGAATLIGSHGVNDLFGLEFLPGTGGLYATQFSGGSGLYKLDTSNGSATVVNAAMNQQIGGLAYDSSRNVLVGIEDGGGALWSIDPGTGAQTLLFAGLTVNDSGLAYDPDIDRLWDIDWNGNLFRYDPTDGYQRTQLLSGLGAHDGLAYVGAVPEPETLSLFAAGLAFLAAIRHRRSAKI